jgi:hypothetical protein
MQPLGPGVVALHARQDAGVVERSCTVENHGIARQSLEQPGIPLPALGQMSANEPEAIN